ncbi:MAG: hypothetical protein C0432_01555 [Candidatus Puniceispirillum sp.]|nr:hypothetical protein [Candidatus Pelagibacter sp.]MBA4282965.1 hypothetical protein [Candidatus Puniceispirillum sp.]
MKILHFILLLNILVSCSNQGEYPDIYSKNNTPAVLGQPKNSAEALEQVGNNHRRSARFEELIGRKNEPNNRSC